MGNKLVKKRQVVDERYTRPQGLYELSKAVDHKKLRKLILESKLAPCYPGTDERGFDLEECPICFMYYPSLNRSKCKAYVQMKPSHSTFLEECTRCPFCKASNYAVEYCGLKTIEEKIVEQIEEQKVIEAKIRMRQQELLDEKERQQGRQESSLMHHEIEYKDMTSQVPPSMPFSIQNEEIIPSERQLVHNRQNKDGGFDVDPDYIMLMEAVWLSIQEHDSQMRVPCEELAGSRGSGPEYHHIASDFAPREPSSSAGLAFTIASMVERQIIDAGSSSSRRPDEQTRSRYIASSEDEGTSTTRHRRVQGDWIDISLESGRLLYGEDAGWMTDQRSKVAEASTSRASSGLHSVSGATTEYSPSMLDHDVYSNYIPTIDGGILPESFEEQIMLAMAISLAEARGQSTLRGS